jgi:hypothetical protein
MAWRTGEEKEKRGRKKRKEKRKGRGALRDRDEAGRKPKKKKKKRKKRKESWKERGKRHKGTAACNVSDSACSILIQMPWLSNTWQHKLHTF